MLIDIVKRERSIIKEDLLYQFVTEYMQSFQFL